MATRKFRIVKRSAGKASGTTDSSREDIGSGIIDIGKVGRIGSGEGETEDGRRGQPARDVADTIPETITGTDSSEDDAEISTQGNVVDPATVPPRRGRGRPRKVDAEGVATATPRTRKKIPPANFNTILVGIHAGIAALLKSPELVIDQTEASVLSEAFYQCADAFGWNLAKVSPKTEATINAAIAVSIIYGPKLKAVSTRAKASKPRIVPMPQRPQGPFAKPPETPMPIARPNPPAEKRAVAEIDLFDVDFPGGAD